MAFRAACAEFLPESVSDVQLNGQQRRADFAIQTVTMIRNTETCRFAQLDPKILTSGVAAWYESCSGAMLNGNYALLDRWIMEQTSLAARNGFGPEELIQLLRTCRSMAIKLEGWNEDIFSTVDEAINDCFRRIFRGTASLPADFDYQRFLEPQPVPALSVVSPAAEALPLHMSAERRGAHRVRVQLPVQVCGSDRGAYVDEVTQTRDVSKGGLSFAVGQNYPGKSILRVKYPYWIGPGAINWEYSAEIVRMDRLEDGRRCLAVRFLTSLTRQVRDTNKN